MTDRFVSDLTVSLHPGQGGCEEQIIRNISEDTLTVKTIEGETELLGHLIPRVVTTTNEATTGQRKRSKEDTENRDSSPRGIIER
jgi:hypothetical protein